MPNELPRLTPESKISLEVALSRADIPETVIAFAFEYSLDRELPIVIVQHEATISAGSRQAKLTNIGFDIPVMPVKTVTIRIYPESDLPPLYMLVAGIGDFQLNRNDKKRIGGIVGLTNTAMTTRSRINPPEFDTIERLGLPPGVVGPFFNSNYEIDLIYLRDNESSPESLVGIATSLTDTLVLRKDIFETLLISSNSY